MTSVEARPAPGPGFPDSVGDAQQVFTAVMQGLARPGQPQAVVAEIAPPPPLTPVAGAVALTLVDEDTPVWLDGPLAASADVRDWLVFHSGAPVTADPARAAFAFVSAPDVLPPLASFNQGSDTYPDRSTTMVICVDGFEGGAAATLTGPGIETQQSLRVASLDGSFWRQMIDNRAQFPRGIDVVFAGPGAVVGLPRSTTVAPVRG